ncbi:cobalt ABC transporter [Thioclava sp. DLFJ4-1]|nr:cobalt ABC transporter [Thioclava sp. DLFJ4-1]
MTRRMSDGATQTSASHIAISDLGHDLDGRPVLEGISLETRARRIGVVGRNGSGKSTLSRLMAGLIAPSRGSLRINGHDLAADRKAALREVGILFQNPDHQIIFPTVIEEISFGLRQQGMKKPEAEATADRTLEQFGKAAWRDAYVTTLSQGQKQLLCLMAVSAMAPNLLILDEPFSGLDIPTKAQLGRALTLYRGTLMQVTHDPRELEHYDEILWLDQGRLRMHGAAREVLPVYVEEMTRAGEADDIAQLSR